MKKAIIQGLIIVGMFFSVWFALAQIDWVSLLKVHKVADQTEEKLGNLFLDSFKKSETEIENSYVINSIDSIVTRICTANKIERESIKIHILNKDEINAFALPGGHIIIYSGLILNSDNQEELGGVICHEIAHIRLNHVMQKLINEVGLSILISMTTGNSDLEAIGGAAKILSSSAFDRSLEKQADIKAVDYLVKANIDPEPFANFLHKLSGKESDANKYLSWISTHPESKERAEYIIEYSRDKKRPFELVLEEMTWEKLKEQLDE